MFSKSTLAEKVRFYLGLALIVPGLYLQIFSPLHSQHHDFAYVFIFAGFAFWQFGTYLFVPLVLFAIAAMLTLIPQINYTVSYALMVLGAALNIWGWWRKRQAKIVQKKLD